MDTKALAGFLFHALQGFYDEVAYPRASGLRDGLLEVAAYFDWNDFCQLLQMKGYTKK